MKGLRSIFATLPHRPARFVTDKGKEYLNKDVRAYLKEQDVQYYHTNNPDTKCSVIERWQRTMKQRLFKVFTHTGSYRYVDGLLDQVVDAYNKSYHRSIGRRPIDVNETNVREVYEKLYGKKNLTRARGKLSYSVGDYVRISRAKHVFEKGYTWNWSDEIFQVIKAIPHPVPVYRIKDLEGQEITGTFYASELQKVKKPEVFKIQYIVRSKGKGDSRSHLVHWRGYPVKSRSWVFDKDIVRS